MIESLVKPYQQCLPLDLGNLLSAMVWGQKNYLSSDQYHLFQNTGLLHLLVLSGQNITLLTNSLTAFLPKARVKERLVLNWLISGFYLRYFYTEPAIVRASLMSLISSLALVSRYNTLAVYILFFSGAVMLLFAPYWWNSYSFWLSFLATAGIILFYRPLITRYQQPALHPLCLAFCAQSLVTPLVLFKFRQLPLLSIVMNCLVEFLIEPIMILGILLSIVGNLFPWQSCLLSYPLFGLLKLLTYLLTLGNYFSERLQIRL